jgi:hypothetical protein
MGAAKATVKKGDVETIREIINLALGDGMEIVVLMALLQTGNENGVSANLSNAGAAQAGIIVRNSLFTRLSLMVTREFASPSREGDLHIGRAFELLKNDTLAIFQGVVSPDDISQRLNSLIHFRDKKAAHLGASRPNIPAAINKDLFALSEATVDLIDCLAKGTAMANVKIRDNIDAKPTVDAFWKPWTN